MCSSADLRKNVPGLLKPKTLGRLMLGYRATEASNRWDKLYEEVYACKSRPSTSTSITLIFLSQWIHCLHLRMRKRKSN